MLAEKKLTNVNHSEGEQNISSGLSLQVLSQTFHQLRFVSCSSQRKSLVHMFATPKRSRVRSIVYYTLRVRIIS